MSIRVVTGSGQVPGQGKAFGRAFIVALLGALLFLHWWPVPFRLDRRGMHDLAADVWVVRSVTGQ